MNRALRRRLYALMLLAFPREVRHKYGPEMTELFESQLEDARQAGASKFEVWELALADSLRHGCGQRIEPVRRSLAAAARGAGRWRWWMHAFRQDLSYAVRLLVRQPGVTTVAMLTLALGIGANTAIFSAVDAMLLRPLPYPDPQRVMTLWEKRPSEGVLDNVVSPGDFLDWAKMNSTFESMAALMTVPADLVVSGEPVRVIAGAVSAPFFDVFRTRPMLGRTFRTDEVIPGKHRVVIIGHRLWQERLGADRTIVGQTLPLSGVPHEVIGVLPASFEFPDSTLDLWVPMAFAAGAIPTRASHYLTVFGRLKPGVTIEQARADMDRVGGQLEQEYGDTNRGHGAHVVSMADKLKTPIRSPLLLLLAAVGFVLLIACVNVANLLLARAAARRREIAVRAAVGAGRARLVGQMLTESVLLALLGGSLGLLVAWWATGALRNLVPAELPVLGMAHIALEPRVLAFTYLISLLTGICFGVLPAWQLAGQDVSVSLKDGSRTAGNVKKRLRATLVVSEIALASLLLVAAGLTIRSFQTLLNIHPGFNENGVLTFGVALPGARYPSSAVQSATFGRIEETLRSIPGVLSVGATTHLPLSGADSRRGVGIEGREPTPDVPTRAHTRSVTPEYFAAMGITIREGRGFTPADRGDAPPVVIVNETMARRYWPGVSPIGKRVLLNGTEIWREVVGIVGDVRHWGLESAVNPELYFPQAQQPWPALTFIVRTAGTPAPLTAAVRERIRAIDASLPLSNIRTMDEVAAESVASRRSGMTLLVLFGILALTLAAAGIYGVMSHMVALRTSEIGIRMTLGAQPSSVVGLVLREGLAQAAAGLAIGIGGGVLVMRTFRAMLFEVDPADPITLMTVTVLLLAAAAAACMIPARRAMRVDPVEALRS